MNPEGFIDFLFAYSEFKEARLLRIHLSKILKTIGTVLEPTKMSNLSSLLFSKKKIIETY